MNERGRAILKAIDEFHQANGYSPSIRELCRLVGIRSSSTLHSYLIRLREEGYVTSVPEKPRTLRVIKKNRF